MKKKILTGFVTSTAVIGLGLAGGIGGYAAETDHASTDIGIGFSGHGPGTTPGQLEIQWAPIGLDFNQSNQVNTATKSFSEVTGTNKYVVVQDTRTSAPSSRAWKLTAKLSELTNATQSEVLTGAVLKFKTAVKGYQGTATPETYGSITDPDGRTASVSAASQTVTAGGAAVNVMKDDNGMSYTIYSGSTAMEMSNIQLEVPANTAKFNQQYKGTLTWSLDNTI